LFWRSSPAFVLLIRRKAAAPAKKPHEVAYERIEVLRRGGLIEKGKVKEFFYELSGIIRSYIEARFGIHAPEMTTEEFLQNVREAGSFTSDHKSLLKDLLSKCDLVKYAKYGPVSYEIETMLEFAVRFIDQTKPEEPEDKPGK